MKNAFRTSLHLTILTVLLTLTAHLQAQTARTASEAEATVLLDKHNEWRKEVNVSPLTWSDNLAQSALAWAISLEESCVFEHSNTTYGENLWKGTTDAFPLTYVVDSWGSEKLDYNYSKNKCKTGKVCGHYTQIVWADSKSVGCAQMTCEGMTTWICQYDPPGNWRGEKPY